LAFVGLGKVVSLGGVGVLDEHEFHLWGAFNTCLSEDLFVFLYDKMNTGVGVFVAFSLGLGEKILVLDLGFGHLVGEMGVASAVSDVDSLRRESKSGNRCQQSCELHCLINNYKTTPFISPRSTI
jgi:hypothetical protein